VGPDRRDRGASTELGEVGHQDAVNRLLQFDSRLSRPGFACFVKIGVWRLGIGR
jgi:hypothetical protein